MSKNKNRLNNKEKKISAFSKEKRLSNFKQRGYSKWNDNEDEDEEESKLELLDEEEIWSDWADDYEEE
jgi:hypothetical protein